MAAWAMRPRTRCLARTGQVWQGITLATLLAATVFAGATDRISVDRTCQHLGYTRIDLRRSGENRLFLFGRLNGQRQSVLVDTGWSFTTVSTNAAALLGTRAKAVLPWQDDHFGTNAQPSAVLMDELNLGRIIFTNQPARMENLVFDGRPAPFDVVLGGDFLARHCALVDCFKSRLYVRWNAPSAQEQGKLEAALSRAGLVSAKLQRNSLLAMTCTARLNGKPLEMLVDTGAPWSCVDLEQAEMLGMKPLPSPRRITGAGSTGTRGIRVAIMDAFSLGDVTLKPVHFALIDLKDWGLGETDKPLSDAKGILGAAELRSTEALIDCHGLRVWLKPAGGRK